MSKTIFPERQSARPTIASICGVIAAVRRFRGSTVASASARPHSPAAVSTAAVALAVTPPVPAAADSIALTTALV